MSTSSTPPDSASPDTRQPDSVRPNPKRPRKNTTPLRKRGAQPGNNNALRHGFYAIKPEVLSRLTTDLKGEFNDESDLLRNLLDTTVSTFNAIDHPTLEQCQTTLRGVSQAIDTLKGIHLTQKVLYNNQTTIEKALEELNNIPPEED